MSTLLPSTVHDCGRIVAIRNGVIEILGPDTGQLLFNCNGVANPSLVKLSPHEGLQKVAVGHSNDSVSICNLEENKVLRTINLDHGATVSCLVWHPRNPDLLLAASNNGAVAVCSSSTGEVTKSLGGHSATVTAAAWSPHFDNRAITGDCNRLAIVWDTDKGQVLAELNTGSPIVSLDWSPFDPKQVLIANQSSVAVWDIDEQRVVMNSSTDNRSNCCQWSPHHCDRVVTGSQSGATVWDTSTGSALQKTEGINNVYHVSWDPHAPDTVGLMSNNRHVIIWNWANNTTLKDLDIGDSSVTDMEWSLGTVPRDIALLHQQCNAVGDYFKAVMEGKDTSNISKRYERKVNRTLSAIKNELKKEVDPYHSAAQIQYNLIDLAMRLQTFGNRDEDDSFEKAIERVRQSLEVIELSAKASKEVSKVIDRSSLFAFCNDLQFEGSFASEIGRHLIQSQCFLTPKGDSETTAPTDGNVPSVTPSGLRSPENQGGGGRGEREETNNTTNETGTEEESSEKAYEGVDIAKELLDDLSVLLSASEQLHSDVFAFSEDQLHWVGVERSSIIALEVKAASKELELQKNEQTIEALSAALENNPFHSLSMDSNQASAVWQEHSAIVDYIQQRISDLERLEKETDDLLSSNEPSLMALRTLKGELAERWFKDTSAYNRVVSTLRDTLSMLQDDLRDSSIDAVRSTSDLSVESSDEDLCMICHVAPQEVVFAPCNHKKTCVECATTDLPNQFSEKLRQMPTTVDPDDPMFCPLCKQKVLVMFVPT